MSGIKVTPVASHEFTVEVTEADETTSHHVVVPSSLLAGWGLEGADEEAVVRESFAFLLEREPATSILPDFSLEIISRYFPEYGEELPRRVAGRV